MTTTVRSKENSPPLPVYQAVQGGCMVARLASGWLIQSGAERAELDASADVIDVANRVQQMLSDHASGSKKCLIAIDSADCFFLDTEPPDRVDLKDRAAVSFELERFFPLDAEAMTSDYSVRQTESENDEPSRPTERLVALAAESERFQPLVMALEEQAIEILSIVPHSLLIARAALASCEETRSIDLWLFGSERAEVLQANADGVWRWKQFPDREQGFQRYQALQASVESVASPVLVVGHDEQSFAKHHLAAPTTAKWSDHSSDQLAAEGASLALAGRWGNWLDLRRGDLAPRDPLYAISEPLKWLAFAAAFCFLSLSVASWYRGERMVRESQSIQQQQRAVYQKAFPNKRVPIAVMEGFRREHRKVLGSRGGGEGVDIPVAATDALSQVYRGFKKARENGKVRFRLQNLNIVGGVCSLTVRVRETTQLVALTKALEEVGLTVTPPASQQMDPTKDENVVTYESTIVAVCNPKKVTSPSKQSSTGRTK